ncbi:hypothetical protein Gotur_035860 [Gossypium turneri]
MQHFPVKSNLLDSDTTKFGFGGNELPLCPKPRRLGPAIPDCLKPLRCTKHRFYNQTYNHRQPYTDGRSGVLNMIAMKVSHYDLRKYFLLRGIAQRMKMGNDDF